MKLRTLRWPRGAPGHREVVEVERAQLSAQVCQRQLAERLGSINRQMARLVVDASETLHEERKIPQKLQELRRDVPCKFSQASESSAVQEASVNRSYMCPQADESS